MLSSKSQTIYSSLLLFLLALSSPHGNAATLARYDPIKTIAYADIVVEAEITRMRVMPQPPDAAEDALPHTWVVIQVVETLKGVAAKTLAIDIPGGWTTDDQYVHVSGTPYLRIGDRVLLALNEDRLSERAGQTVFTTWSKGFARRVLASQERSTNDNILDYGVNGSNSPLIGLDTAVIPESCKPGLEPALDRCSFPILGWNELKLKWVSAVQQATTTKYWREGTVSNPFLPEQMP